MVDTINKDNTAHIDNEPQGNAAVQHDDPSDRRIGDVNDLIGANVLELMSKIRGDNEVYEYTQNVDPLKMFCTVMGPTGLISSYHNTHLTYANLLDIFKHGVQHYTYQKNVGHSTNNGVKCAINYWKTKKGNQHYYFRAHLTSREAREALDRQLGLVITYRGNRKYGQDRNKDLVLDGTSFGTPTYGHCLWADTIVTYNGAECIRVRDSYVGRASNTYYIPWDHLNQLIRNGVFYPTGYIILDANPILEQAKMPADVFAKLMHIKRANSFIREHIEKLQKTNKLSDADNKKLDSMQDHYHQINNTIRSIEG